MSYRAKFGRFLTCSLDILQIYAEIRIRIESPELRYCGIRLSADSKITNDVFITPMCVLHIDLKN